MEEEEEWRTVPSLPEYEASSLGRVRRVPFVGKMPHGGLRQYGGKAWYGVWHPGTGQGRYQILFRKRNYKAARMVCEAFHGPPPPDKPVCMHIDEDSRNNRPGNLRWGTQRENLNFPMFLEYTKSGGAGKRVHPRNASSRLKL